MGLCGTILLHSFLLTISTKKKNVHIKKKKPQEQYLIKKIQSKKIK